MDEPKIEVTGAGEYTAADVRELIQLVDEREDVIREVKRIVRLWMVGSIPPTAAVLRIKKTAGVDG